VTETRSGYVYGFIAYLSWGFFPLYWPLLAPAESDEVLAHRFVWSLAFCLILLTAAKLWPQFLAVLRSPKKLALMAAATAVIAVNWGGFIWGVTHGYVLEAALGYFINPLITVALGVLVLGEKLRPLQWLAISTATFAVIVMTVGLGRPPWLALALACSFAAYGLIKKKADLGTIESLSVETLLAFPIALGYLLWLGAQGSLAFGHSGNLNTWLLVGTGAVTAFPLLMFGAAATRISLTSLGLLQYVGPVVQFVIGLTIFNEQMPPSRWAGFALVWMALCVFTFDAIRAQRRSAETAAEPTVL
jgi:chloramphenicol-sensitive protein RarD